MQEARRNMHPGTPNRCSELEIFNQRRNKSHGCPYNFDLQLMCKADTVSCGPNHFLYIKDGRIKAGRARAEAQVFFAAVIRKSRVPWAQSGNLGFHSSGRDSMIGPPEGNWHAKKGSPAESIISADLMQPLGMDLSKEVARHRIQFFARLKYPRGATPDGNPAQRFGSP